MLPSGMAFHKVRVKFIVHNVGRHQGCLSELIFPWSIAAIYILLCPFVYFEFIFFSFMVSIFVYLHCAMRQKYNR